MSDSLIYHLCRAQDWQEAKKLGVYRGSSEDRSDGFLHFSSAAQVEKSARKHRGGEPDLLLLCVTAAALGNTLKWEDIGGGRMFPHLYGELPLAAVVQVETLPLDEQGLHRFPAHLQRQA